MIYRNAGLAAILGTWLLLATSCSQNSSSVQGVIEDDSFFLVTLGDKRVFMVLKDQVSPGSVTRLMDGALWPGQKVTVKFKQSNEWTLTPHEGPAKSRNLIAYLTNDPATGAQASPTEAVSDEGGPKVDDAPPSEQEPPGMSEDAVLAVAVSYYQLLSDKDYESAYALRTKDSPVTVAKLSMEWDNVESVRLSNVARVDTKKIPSSECYYRATRRANGTKRWLGGRRVTFC
ncbi:MAG: hypothetical protein CMLOHMNK_03327 [Steroidobacteraceae bacterium]|nr:hypothetical protein [Steroidobacteraceae bacterium]